MKTLINGRWTDRKDEKQSNDGSFKRKDTEFRNWITPDGSPGETGVGGFKAENTLGTNHVLQFSALEHINAQVWERQHCT